MWECRFDILLSEITANPPATSIPDILKSKQTEEDLLDGIREGRLYGFIVCDVWSPPEVIEALHDFPPIIKRMELTDEHLSPYMRDRIYTNNPKMKSFKRTTLVQGFTAKEHLLLTSLAKYYMAKGIVLSNVKRFIQYVPRKCLSPFVEHVTKMRIEAELNGETTKGNTAKIYGNSGYGKVIIYYINLINYLF